MENLPLPLILQTVGTAVLVSSGIATAFNYVFKLQVRLMKAEHKGVSDGLNSQIQLLNMQVSLHGKMADDYKRELKQLVEKVVAIQQDIGWIRQHIDHDGHAKQLH